MEWEKLDLQTYQRVYWTYELSVNQTIILNFCGREIFKEFPKTLPENIRNQWENNNIFLLKIFKKALSSLENKIIDETKDMKPGNSDILMNQVAFYESMIGLGINADENIDFQRLFFSQELVMVFAHLEAFLSDSLRIICRVRPEILKSNKKIDRSKVIDLGNWNKIIEFLIEDYIYDFGWGPFKDKIKFLNNNIGLNIEISDSELSILEEAENIRNIIVHNGGRISQEYINRTKKNDLNVGDLIPITSEFMDEVESEILFIGSNISFLISKKFFDANDSKLRWRFKKSH